MRPNDGLRADRLDGDPRLTAPPARGTKRLRLRLSPAAGTRRRRRPPAAAAPRRPALGDPDHRRDQPHTSRRAGCAGFHGPAGLLSGWLGRFRLVSRGLGHRLRRPHQDHERSKLNLAGRQAGQYGRPNESGHPRASSHKWCSDNARPRTSQHPCGRRSVCFLATGASPQEAPPGLRERAPGRVLAYRDKVIDTLLGPVTVMWAWYHSRNAGNGLAPRDAEMGHWWAPLPSAMNTRRSRTADHPAAAPAPRSDAAPSTIAATPPGTGRTRDHSAMTETDITSLSRGPGFAGPGSIHFTNLHKSYVAGNHPSISPKSRR